MHRAGFLCCCLAAAAAAASDVDWHERRAVLARAMGGCSSAMRAPRRLGAFDSTATSTARAAAAAAIPEVITAPLPEACLEDADVPAAWDWRSVAVAKGVPAFDYTSRVRNQFLPFWCGSCWAHAATAVMGSRFLIHGTKAATARVDFSVQYFVNCVTESFPGEWHPTPTPPSTPPPMHRRALG